MKKAWIGILLIITTVVAIILNFNSALQGSVAVLKDFIVTFIFLVVWGVLLVHAVKHKEYNVILPSIVFWTLSLITALLVIAINSFDLTINIVIPFVIVFLTPLYGIRILGVSHIFAQIIMAVIAAIYVACGFYGFFRREKGK